MNTHLDCMTKMQAVGDYMSIEGDQPYDQIYDLVLSGRSEQLPDVYRWQPFENMTDGAFMSALEEHKDSLTLLIESVCNFVQMGIYADTTNTLSVEELLEKGFGYVESWINDDVSKNLVIWPVCHVSEHHMSRCEEKDADYFGLYAVEEVGHTWIEDFNTKDESISFAKLLLKAKGLSERNLEIFDS